MRRRRSWKWGSERSSWSTVQVYSKSEITVQERLDGAIPLSSRASPSTSISSQAGQMGRKSSICGQLETSPSKSRHLLVTEPYVEVGGLIVSPDHDVFGWLVMPATSERN